MLNAPPSWPNPLPTAEGRNGETPFTVEDTIYGETGLNAYLKDAIPTRVGDPQQHRWFMPIEIGVRNAQANSTVAGLPAGQTQTINTDQRPDYWIISITGDANASALLYLAPGAGGVPIRLGANGKAKIPAQGQSYLTISNAGASGNLFGTVIAMAGYELADFSLSA